MMGMKDKQAFSWFDLLFWFERERISEWMNGCVSVQSVQRAKTKRNLFLDDLI